MFTLGKDFIVGYVSKTGSSSAYGAAGSLAAVLLWVYYSSLVFLLGASFAHEWARQFGTLRDEPDQPSDPSSTSTATSSYPIPPAPPMP